MLRILRATARKQVVHPPCEIKNLTCALNVCPHIPELILEVWVVNLMAIPYSEPACIIIRLHHDYCETIGNPLDFIHQYPSAWYFYIPKDKRYISFFVLKVFYSVVIFISYFANVPEQTLSKMYHNLEGTIHLLFATMTI